jgi:transglutaminase-like putative cysteine protease
MKKGLLIGLLITMMLPINAQKAVIEESVTDIVCDGPTHAITHYKEVVTILNPQGGASLANFACSCSDKDKLTSFKGLVTDANGRVIRKLKESELQKNEISPYLAVDDYTMYLDYAPPVYPVTITYEWTIDSRDDLITFPRFCPQTSYDVSVKKASYRLKAPKSMTILHAQQNIPSEVNIDKSAKYTQLLTLEVNDLPMLENEPYSRPLREKVPMARFAPADFTYYGTQGSQRSWKDLGLWQYSLIQGLDVLPENVRQQLHQLTDTMKTDREKVEALYRHLGKTTRYVAILLGIGGMKPATATSVYKSGFGDCKGLTNYMRAMLKEVGIASNYILISTTNRRFMKDYTCAGQMNHAILQVPLPNDTLWLECTNPQLPMGYVHEDIAGHDAIEITEQGGRLVRLPLYADSTNLMRSTVNIHLSQDGTADLKVSQETFNRQYEDRIPLTKMNEKERQKILPRIVYAPLTEINRIDISENGARISMDTEIKSQKYANQTGQRLFVPICPLHHGYTVPNHTVGRQEDIWLELGYQDEDDITLTIPEGYTIEACPKDINIEQPFASFSFSIKRNDKTIHVKNRLLMKSGTFDKSLFPQFTEFLQSISNIYHQKIILKKIPL